MVFEVPADTLRLVVPNKLLPSSQQPGDCSWHPTPLQAKKWRHRKDTKRVSDRTGINLGHPASEAAPLTTESGPHPAPPQVMAPQGQDRV